MGRYFYIGCDIDLGLDLGLEVSKDLGLDLDLEVSKDLGLDLDKEVSKDLGLDLGLDIVTEVSKIIYQYPTIAVINNPSLWVTEHGITFPLTINILIITLCLTYGISISSVSLLC